MSKISTPHTIAYSVEIALVSETADLLAAGTSTMKATLNGMPSLSDPDGNTQRVPEQYVQKAYFL